MTHKLYIVQYDDRPVVPKKLASLIDHNKVLCSKESNCVHVFKTKSDMPPYWAKVEAVRDVMTSTSPGSLIVWVDSDAAIRNIQSLREILSKNTMTISGDMPPWSSPFNAGVWGIKNDIYGKQLIEEWLALFPSGNWSRSKSGTWKCHACIWAGTSYEQGSFAKYILTKYEEHIQRVPWDVINYPHCKAKPSTIVHHFAGNYKENIDCFIGSMHVPPSYIIKLDQSDTSVLETVQTVIPTAQYCKAFDFRKKDPLELLKSGNISILGYNSIIYGRKRHSELGSTGAVGLWHSVRNILERCKNNPWTLVMEEDIVIPDADKLIRVVYTLTTAEKFNHIDCVILGASRIVGYSNDTDNTTNMLNVTNDVTIERIRAFSTTTCVLWSQKGIQRILDLTEQMHLEVQYDHLLYILSQHNDFELWGETSLTTQTQHVSTIQKKLVLTAPMYECEENNIINLTHSVVINPPSRILFIICIVLLIALICVTTIAILKQHRLKACTR